MPKADPDGAGVQRSGAFVSQRGAVQPGSHGDSPARQFPGKFITVPVRYKADRAALMRSGKHPHPKTFQPIRRRFRLCLLPQADGLYSPRCR